MIDRTRIDELLDILWDLYAKLGDCSEVEEDEYDTLIEQYEDELHDHVLGAFSPGDRVKHLSPEWIWDGTVVCVHEYDERVCFLVVRWDSGGFKVFVEDEIVKYLDHV